MTAIITALEIPYHVENFDGRLVNTEVSEHSIKELRDYAERQKFDLEAECKAHYGYGSEWLMRDEYTAMMSAIGIHQAARFESEPKHFHRCPTCGDSRLYFDRYCEDTHPAGDTDDECRSCDEGTGAFYRGTL